MHILASSAISGQVDRLALAGHAGKCSNSGRPLLGAFSFGGGCAVVKTFCVFVVGWSWGVLIERIYNDIGLVHTIGLKEDMAFCLIQLVALVILLAGEAKERRQVAKDLDVMVQEINGRFMQVKEAGHDQT
jgi:hypothetical protein